MYSFFAYRGKKKVHLQGRLVQWEEGFVQWKRGCVNYLDESGALC